MANLQGIGDEGSANAPCLAACSKAQGRRATRPRLSPGKRAAGATLGTVVDPLASQWLATIVEGSDDAIIGKSLDGTVGSWNSGATRIFGYTSAEMIGSPISRLIPDELAAEEVEILARLARGERFDHFETVRIAKDRRRVPVSLAVSPILDAVGKVVGASNIARDLSSRKAAEQTLRDAKDQAQRMQAEADNANQAKTDFLAAMSHEIRTPLNCIEGVIYLLTRSQALTPEQLRYADLVKNASVALRIIVDDILDFSKVEAGQLDLEPRPFELAALIRDTVAIVAPLATAKNLELTCVIDAGAPKWVSGDQRRLRQVLLNLLANAVKFTMEGSVKLAAGSQTAADGREQMVFSVTDTGLGVATENLHRLFRAFSQADNAVNRLHGGTGLGLAICKRIVEMMGGEIGIVSEIGEGSIVSFTAHLPSVAGPALVSEKPVDKVGVRNCRILVVDDIDTNLEIVETYLQDAGHSVVSVNSGLGAIQLLGNSRFDLVLMDVQMPMMDGVTATRCIRALSAPIGDIPIIAMTAHVLPQQVKTFLEAGMNDHIGKPIELAKLLEMVRRWQPGAGKDGVCVESDPTDFDRPTLDTFVLAVGTEKATLIAHKFLESLSGAFKSTFTDSQHEAHDLINTAGVFGLCGFVRACREIAEVAPSQELERSGQVLQEMQRAQSIALRTLTKQLLAKLRAVAVPPVRRRA